MTVWFAFLIGFLWARQATQLVVADFSSGISDPSGKTQSY